MKEKAVIRNYILKIIVISLIVVPFAIISLPSKAKAENLLSGGGIDNRLFKPAVDSKGFFTTNASPILPHLGLSFGFITDYANSLFRLQEDTDNSLVKDGTYIFEHAWWGSLSANIGFFNCIQSFSSNCQWNQIKEFAG